MSGIPSLKLRLTRSRLYRAAAPYIAYARDKWFDLTHGVDTAGDVPLSRLTVDSANRTHGIMYATISDKLLTAIISGLPIDHERYTFIDFGSGKGKAVLMAAQWPFRKVIGVEFAKELIAVSRDNLARIRAEPKRAGAVELVHGDAADFVLPDGPLVLYFYNPFREPVMRRVLENLRASISREPREVVVVYVNPELRNVFEEWPELKLIATHRWHMLYALNLPGGPAGASPV